MDDSAPVTIVQGLRIDPQTGQADVDPDLSETLLDLAEVLEEHVRLPVDVEHVVAAVVLAARKGSFGPETQLDPSNSVQRNVLAEQVQTIFVKYDGQVGQE